MKLPTVTVSLLTICSIVNAVPFPAKASGTAVSTKQPTEPRLKDATKALNPSLKDKVTAVVTGKPQPAKKQVADIPNTNSVAVRNEDKKVFTVDKNKEIGQGAYGTVYQAKSHSDPKSQTVMKESHIESSYRPGTIPKNKGESEKDYGNRLNTARQGIAKNDRAQAKAEVEKENGFNERMGISAGKPVVASNGFDTKTYMPMKKVPGAPLHKELVKGREDPSYIPTHTLLYNAKHAIDETNNNGISHNDAHVGNIMVTKNSGKMIDYGAATDRTDETDRLKDHKELLDSLKGAKSHIPPSRMDSFNHAVNLYDDQIKNPTRIGRHN